MIKKWWNRVRARNQVAKNRGTISKGGAVRFNAAALHLTEHDLECIRKHTKEAV